MFLHPQEMEKLKEELENMNDLMEQKDTLTQKLEVSDTTQFHLSSDLSGTSQSQQGTLQSA